MKACPLTPDWPPPPCGDGTCRGDAQHRRPPCQRSHREGGGAAEPGIQEGLPPLPVHPLQTMLMPFLTAACAAGASDLCS